MDGCVGCGFLGWRWLCNELHEWLKSSIVLTLVSFHACCRRSMFSCTQSCMMERWCFGSFSSPHWLVQYLYDQSIRSFQGGGRGFVLVKLKSWRSRKKTMTWPWLTTKLDFLDFTWKMYHTRSGLKEEKTLTKQDTNRSTNQTSNSPPFFSVHSLVLLIRYDTCTSLGQQ